MASTSPFPWPRSRDIHIITLVPATLSFLATATASYWFFALLKAQRNFRRTLVLVLILADCSKSLWIMIFSIVGLATSDNIPSRSPFCQAGGFFLQASYEACGSSSACIGWTSRASTDQPPDLAILFLITHVSLQILPPLCVPRSQDGLWQVRHWILFSSILLPVIDAAIPFVRLPNNPAYQYDGVYCSLFAGPLSLSLALSWVPRYVLWLYLLILLTRLFVYIRGQSYMRPRDSIASAHSEPSIHVNDGAVPQHKIHETGYSTSSTVENGDAGQAGRQHSIAASISTIGSRIMKPRKQVQAVALYPLFYVLAWAVPFSAQVNAFSNSQSINANYGLRAAAVCCISSLGMIDVIIFCSKERPWRHSLHVRRRIQRSRQASLEDDSMGGTAVISTVSSDRRPHGGGSDQERRRTLQAYERLALEQADALARPAIRRASLEHDLSPQSLPDAGDSA